MTDDARTALIARLKLHRYELVNGGANASDLRSDLLAAAEALAALRTPAPDLRAWVQHLPSCAKSSTRLIVWVHNAVTLLFTRFGAMESAGKSAVCTCGLTAALSAHDHLRPSGESAD